MTQPIKAPIKTLLVANRGEIALRIMRTARDRGLGVVAVYSDADAGAAHVRFADHAVRIGPSPAAQSYLSTKAILKAAQQAGADAIHPGYGFLSENAGFAAACANAGLVFVGPSPEVISLMGDKARAREAMKRAGVPVVPGFEGMADDAALLAEADAIGFPVMIKAAAGGGGKGMRLVTSREGFAEALTLARSEARAAFDDDKIILEKAVTQARHVEIQVMADHHGNVIHLGERDCSVQRRHQKVIEESPGPTMTPDLRARMGDTAVRAAQAVGYVGAGTVEFLLDGDGNFYFLEMNTRLQVEHPVTEMVTGLDLVALQLLVAEGAAVPVTLDDVRITGWAMEARLYAEDPTMGFLPSAGRIMAWRPAPEPLARTDAGIATGDIVSAFYDPMLAKVIAFGETRDAARQALIAALGETVILGPVTNRDFLIGVLRSEAFADGLADTGWLDGADMAALLPPPMTPDQRAVVAAVAFHAEADRNRAHALDIPDELMGWSSAGEPTTVLDLEIDGEPCRFMVHQSGPDMLRVVTPDADDVVTGQGRDMRVNGALAGIVEVRATAQTLDVVSTSRTIRASFPGLGGGAGAGGDGGQVAAPMHGILTGVHVTDGDRVQAGDALMVLEAMKMQHQIRATRPGIIRDLTAQAGAQVAQGALLCRVEDEGGDDAAG
ncbi:biotin carboxylase N-terminal domain-containing protein [Shimia biformata]|uniref:ATP-binding protein n=1 Tax=Shimia biformata TaxID=1294299 RepID=UPI00194F5676|nr:biotin carboxylase N-terminal domain-containing protein [Shimia biformata]